MPESVKFRNTTYKRVQMHTRFWSGGWAYKKVAPRPGLGGFTMCGHCHGPGYMNASTDGGHLVHFCPDDHVQVEA